MFVKDLVSRTITIKSPDMDESQQYDLSQRLSRIEGQVRGIGKMVDTLQETVAILLQLMALQKATRAAATFLVKAQAITSIREQIHQALTSCPGACDHFDALLQAHLKVS